MNIKVNISLSRRSNNERLKNKIEVINLWRELSSRFRKLDCEIPLVKKSDIVQEEVKSLSVVNVIIISMIRKCQKVSLKNTLAVVNLQLLSIIKLRGTKK